MNKNVQVMMDIIEKESNSTIDIRQLITNMTLDTICATAMGTTVGAQSNQADKRHYILPIDSAMIQFTARLFNPLFQSDLIYGLSLQGQENKQNIAKIHQFVCKVIKDRKEIVEKMVQNNKNLDTTMADDVYTRKKYAFLDSLLMAHLENPLAFTEKDVLDEVNTFMFEGNI